MFTVIAVLVIIPLTSNIMEDVFRITGRQKGYSEETLFQCFIDNEYGMLTDKIEYNKGVGRKITKEEENYYAFSDCYNAAVDYKMYIKNNEMTKAEEMLDKFCRKNEEKITGRIFIDALVSIKEVYRNKLKEKKMENRVINAAILGAGTVGGGVYKLAQAMEEDIFHKTGARLCH